VKCIYHLHLTGIQEPRNPVQGKSLPSARLVSTNVVRNGDSVDTSRTLSLVQWTEFIEHDLVFTPVMKMGKFLDCSKWESLITYSDANLPYILLLVPFTCPDPF
jgi:hypothetical protein